jgi:two-component system sensor histidine kinase DesK
MAGLSRLASTLRDLHAARGELAHQAVMAERLRLARDLHDLLGHNLSLIALKSELAGRVIEADPARAAQEIRDVEQAARLALRDVREAVAGYRQPTLHAELDAARQLLAAAGIEVTIEAHVAGLDPATDAMLAWAVREGVTNVIRHSRASHCTVQVKHELSLIFVEIVNDGYCGKVPEGTQAGTGQGLIGLAERARSHGGRVEAGPRLEAGMSGYRLRLEMPELGHIG